MADKIVPAVSYLTQIRILDEELERHQLRCDELKKQNRDLSFVYGAVEKNRDDLCDYLIHSSTEAKMRLKELSELLECHEKMLEQQQEEEEELMQILAHLESIEKQLVTEREEHEAAVARLKSQMDSEQANNSVFQDTMNQVKSSIRNKVAAAVEEKKTWHEEVLAEAQELLKDCGELLEAAKTLLLKNSELRIEMDDMEVDLHQTLQEIDGLRKEDDEMFKECQQLMVDLNNCSKVCHPLLAEEPQVEVELQEEMSSRRQLEADVQEAANILRPAVMEALLSEGIRDSPDPSDSAPLDTLAEAADC